MEKFIREFILEENPLDVREVRSALRAYHDTQKRLEKQYSMLDAKLGTLNGLSTYVTQQVAQWNKS